MGDWKKSRKIVARLVVQGTLELTSPAHLGNGESEGLTDMPLLRDPLENRPLLTGTSIAGALRGYMLTRKIGYGKVEQKGMVDDLFGMVKGDDADDAGQSPLIVEDALGTAAGVGVEVRDGVRINAATRTAEDKFKYDSEFLAAGTSFELRFELLLPDDTEKANKLKAGLAAALQALETGEIAIGARKSRGFGRCQVRGWRVIEFDLRQPQALLDWLRTDQDAQMQLPQAKAWLTIASLLGSPIENDARESFTIHATFALASPLLIRSEEPLTDGDHQPDVAHLRNGRGEPVVSGTSLAGVLRARALRIVNTLGVKADIIDGLFGRDMQVHQANPSASRLIVEEVVVREGKPLVQNRVGIDRFTGGAFDTALFAEAPQVGGAVELRLQLRQPNVTDEADKQKQEAEKQRQEAEKQRQEAEKQRQEAQIGLLLLLLKDLWTSDLPLGGTSSIGRGRLRGVKAELTRKQASVKEPDTWTIEQVGDKLHLSDDGAQLNTFVEALLALQTK
ncbi:MAG: RAMP superfamily CRISPR-associated protein [Chloroflexaceae bacterium]|jgi:CRISPR/Cas system CMR subunit Cmr4 (Cas7 group RAMP superfamily)|nr:RAMP superfamily CRISPR-associated protein [Chloroflexaceae bacterium]